MSLTKRQKIKRLFLTAVTLVGLFGVTNQGRQILNDTLGPKVVYADDAAEKKAKENNKKTSEKKNEDGNPSYSWNMNADYDLSADPTYSDLYASIIFSKGNDSTVNRVSLGYNEIMQYGAPSAHNAGDGSSKDQIYGNLTQEDSSQRQGRILANYLYTLNKYQWLSTNEADSSKPGWQKFLDKAVGSGKTFLARTMLNTATFGASMYNSFSGAIENFGKFMGSLDIPARFGFRTQSKNDQKNFVNQLLQGVFDQLGMTKDSFEMLGKVIWIVLAAGAVIGIMAQLSKLQMNRAMQLLGRLFLRIWVIAMTMYGTGFLQSIIDTFTADMTNDMKSVVDYDKNYVVDTLDWAVYGNLDISMIGTGSMESLDSENQDTAAEKFYPSEENIARLNAAISAVKQGKDKDDETNAVDYISDLSSGAQANVNDYFAAIKNEPRSAARKGPSSSSSITAGYYYSHKWYSNKFPPYVYFLSNNGSKDKDAKYDTLTKIFEDPSDDAAKDRQVSWYLFGPKDGAGQLAVPYIQTQNPYKFRRMKLSNPETYIYGASASNSDQSGNYNNFINGKGTDQNNDPMTTEDSEYTGDGSLKIAMYTNSLGIAIDNRYGGVSAGKNGGQTLSTQSTSFVLQTALSKDKVLFQGYNTAVSTTDKGKSTDVDGATFTRYVMPAENSWVRLARIGALNLNWLLAGVCALLAFWYLLTAPMISATIKMIASFFRALLTGNLISLLQYLAYYAAVQASFSFAQIAIYVGSIFGGLVIKYVPWLGNLITVADPVSATVGAASGSAIPSMAAIIVSLFMAFLMAWPIFTINFNGRRNAPKKVGLVGIVVLIPYTLAETFDKYLDQFEVKLYGRSHRNSFLHRMSDTIKPISQRDQAKKVAQGVLNAGVALGTAAFTGGTSLAMQTAGKMALGKALSSVAGDGANPEDATMADYGDQDERGLSLFDKGKTMLNNYRFANQELSSAQGVVDALDRDDYLNRLDHNEEVAFDDNALKPYMPKETPVKDETVKEKSENADNVQQVADEIEQKVDTVDATTDDIAIKHDKSINIDSDDINANIAVDPVQLKHEHEPEFEDKKFNGLGQETNTKDQNLLQGIHDELVDVEKAITDQEVVAKMDEMPKSVLLDADDVSINKLNAQNVDEQQTTTNKAVVPEVTDVKLEQKDVPVQEVKQNIHQDVEQNVKQDAKPQPTTGQPQDKSDTKSDTKSDKKDEGPIVLNNGYIPKVEPQNKLEERVQSMLMKDKKYNIAETNYQRKADNYNAVRGRYDDVLTQLRNSEEPSVDLVKKAIALEKLARVSLTDAQIAKSQRDEIRVNVLNKQPKSRDEQIVRDVATHTAKAMGNLTLGTMSHMLGYETKDGLKNPFDPVNNPLLKGHKEAVKERGNGLADSQGIKEALDKLNEQVEISNDLQSRMNDNIESTQNFQGWD